MRLLIDIAGMFAIWLAIVAGAGILLAFGITGGRLRRVIAGLIAITVFVAAPLVVLVSLLRLAFAHPHDHAGGLFDVLGGGVFIVFAYLTQLAIGLVALTVRRFGFRGRETSRLARKLRGEIAIIHYLATDPLYFFLGAGILNRKYKRLR